MRLATQKARLSPRVSINKLAEYMIASPRRRRTIVKDQKYPPDFKVAIYSEALNAITSYIAAPDEGKLIAAMEAALAKKGDTEWELQRNQLCAEAIEAFLDFASDMTFDGVTAERSSADAAEIEIAGVVVSVRPEILLKFQSPKGVKIIGGMKICFCKSSPVGEEAASYITGTLHSFLKSGCRDGELADPSLILAMDVFDRKVHFAPKAFKARMADVEAACEEISRAWPAV
jgi:hypothetical protein